MSLVRSPSWSIVRFCWVTVTSTRRGPRVTGTRSPTSIAAPFHAPGYYLRNTRSPGARNSFCRSQALELHLQRGQGGREARQQIAFVLQADGYPDQVTGNPALLSPIQLRVVSEDRIGTGQRRAQAKARTFFDG